MTRLVTLLDLAESLAVTGEHDSVCVGADLSQDSIDAPVAADLSPAVGADLGPGPGDDDITLSLER